MGREAIHISERYASIGAIVLMLLCASCASDRPTEREVLKKFPQDQPPSILAERMRAKEVEKEPGQPVPAPEAMTALPPGPATPLEARMVEVTGLQVQGQGPAGATILVTADGTLTDYESFALPNPPRLVIDLPRARHAIAQPVTLPAGSPILKIRTTQYREHPVPVVRLVFDLGQPLPYRLELTGNQMQILVSEEASKEVSSVAGSKQAEPGKQDTPSAEAPKPSEPPTVVQVAPSAADGTAESTGFVAPATGVEVVEKGEAKPAEDISPAAPLEARMVEVTGLQVQGRGPAGATILVTVDGTLTDYESFTLPNPPRLVIDLPRARHAIRQPVTLPAGSPILKIRTTQYREHPVPVVRLVFDLGQPLPFKTDRVETGLQVSLGEVAQESVPSTMAEAPKKEAAVKAQPPLRRKPPPAALARRPRPEPRPAPSRESPKTMELPPLSALPPERPIAPAPPTMPKAALSNNRLSLDFKGADLDDLLRLISEVSGLNMVAAHELKERKDRDITIRLTNVEWRQALDLILRTKKLSYEQDGNVIYVGLKADIQKAKEERVKDIQRVEESRLKVEEVRWRGEEERKKAEGARKKVEEEERLYAEEPKCTKLIQLAHTKASEVKKHLDSLKTRRGSVELDERTNTLIVNDVQSACLKMAAIAKELDAPPKDPFVTKLLTFNYAKAGDLRANLTALKTPQGSVVVDERSSRIIVKDLQQAVERIETFLKQIDIPTPQVLIEARIVEASRTFSQSLGVQWGGAGIPTSTGSRTGVTTFGGSGVPPGGSIQFPPLTPTDPNPFPVGTNPAPFFGPVPLALNLPALAAAGANPFILGATVGSLANRYLVGLQLSAAEREGRLRTLSSPRVATQDNEEAEIKQGTQVPFTTIDSSGRTVVAFQDAFIKLKVKPHITPDGRVSMKVEAERSFAGDRITFETGFVFPINTRKVTTNILVPNGSTVVIGGLLQSTEQIVDDRVPFLGRIPILSWLFKRQSIGPDDRVELLIFLTPSVLQESRT
ncbi:MAG: AMIN domain-containing protein [candidate division NC10 bacterium]|nr:AMIN domain-containing protein [candidate division NC10 bacterium]